MAVRVWELPVANLLTGGVATLPLALLSNITGTEPEQIVATMHERIVADAKSEDDAEKVLTGAYILAGLRFSDTIVQSLFEGILHMEESSTYQAILRQGEARSEAKWRAAEARKMLILFGESRLGVPSPSITAALNSIAAPNRLEEMAKRLADVASWDDLLAITRIDG